MANKAAHSAKAEITPEQRAKINAAARARRITKREAARQTMLAANAYSMAAKFLTIEQLEIHLNRGRASIYRDIMRGTLPRPIKLSPRCSRWDAAAVDAAIAALATGV